MLQARRRDDVDYHVVHDEGWCAEETDEETGTPRGAKRGNQTGYYQVLFGLSLVQERPVARRGVSCRLEWSPSWMGSYECIQLQELVAIIAAALQSQMPKEDAGLLREDIDKFQVRLPSCYMSV